jgi:secreted trypsin-like serine protease
MNVLMNSRYRSPLLLLVIAGTAATVVATVPADAASSLAGESTTGSVPYREVAEAWIKNEKTKQKIVDGKIAPAGAYPWQVSLDVSWIADPVSAHFCGGTVYSATWVVTAAHCVQGTAAKDILVTAGTNKLGGGVRVNVSRVIVRSDYKPGNQDNDLALIELLSPLPLGQNIAALPLLSAAAEDTALKKGAPLVVTGWGATVQGGSTVRDLRYVEIPFVERTECNRPLAYDGAVTDNMICAGAMAGGMDSCQGDSGGPLVSKSGAKSVLAGVVSWGEGCAKPNKVGVYTRVPKFEAWISSCTQNGAKCD